MTAAGPSLRFVDAFQGTSGPTRLHGRRTESTHETRRYLQRRVRERVRIATTERLIENYLEELRSTGFEVEGLGASASSERQPFAWEIGEALAETLLEDTEDVVFPWPPAWDKRTESASLPGPDLVGLHQVESPRLVFGEVKTSSEKSYPPGVIHGDDGLRAQLLELIRSERRRATLIAWLTVRARNQVWKSTLNEAAKAYFASPSDARIFGVLLRDTEPDVKDLASVKQTLDKEVTTYGVALLAFYLPIPIAQWAQALAGTEESP